MSKVCEGGHKNQAGGCCCPQCGNTCGFHPEWQRGSGIPLPLRTKQIWDNVDGSGEIEQLAQISPEWEQRLKVLGLIGEQNV